MNRRRIEGLDGLRALAVVLVLLYHLLPGWAPRGFVGVDVFLVLSGYLITHLLVEEIRANGRIDLVAFWTRRFRRLVPALLTVVLVVVPLALLVAWLRTPDVLVGIRRQVLSAITFTHNWATIIGGATYFDQATPALLKNMWSLAVEEQFYLVWPFFLALPFLRRKARFLGTVLGVISAGAALALGFGLEDPTRVHLGTDTHAYGLMLGACLALASARLGRRGAHHCAGRVMSGAPGWLGLAALVVLSFVPLPFEVPMPVVSVIASLLTFVVLLSLDRHHRDPARARILAGVLEFVPFAWLGQRSYGIYLWHWPLAVLAFFAWPTWPMLPRAGVIAVLSVLAAALSHRFVETPIRRNGLRRSVREVVGAHPLILVPVLLALVATITALALQPRMTTAEAAILAAQGGQSDAARNADDPASAGNTVVVEVQRSAQQSGAPQGAEAPDAQAPKVEEKPEMNEAPVNPGDLPPGDRIVVLGDSVTLASTPALRAAFPGAHVDGAQNRRASTAADLLAQTDASIGARPYVVVGMPTNTTFRTEWMDALLQVVGPNRKLILVNGFAPDTSGWIWDSNTNIDAFAAAHPGQVFVADWASAIRPHTDLLAGDLIHPSGAGGEYYAQAVARALVSATAAR